MEQEQDDHDFRIAHPGWVCSGAYGSFFRACIALVFWQIPFRNHLPTINLCNGFPLKSESQMKWLILHCESLKKNHRNGNRHNYL